MSAWVELKVYKQKTGSCWFLSKSYQILWYRYYNSRLLVSTLSFIAHCTMKLNILPFIVCVWIEKCYHYELFIINNEWNFMEILCSYWVPFPPRLKDHFPSADSMQASCTSDYMSAKKVCSFLLFQSNHKYNSLPYYIARMTLDCLF